jgi:cytochrome b561
LNHYLGGCEPENGMADERRYGAVAMILHWIIAVLILVQIGLGWYFNHFVPDHSPEQDRLQDIHVEIGLTTLILILVRIGWRLSHPPPPLPQDMAAWERGLAGASHTLFYLLMLAMPLTGWALVSIRGEDIPFWGLEFPAMPGLHGVWQGPAHRAARHQLQGIHTDILVWIALANLALHVAGALKHQFDGHPVIWRMLPIARPGARTP